MRVSGCQPAGSPYFLTVSRINHSGGPFGLNRGVADGKEKAMDIDEALLDGEDRMIKTVADFERYMKGVRTGEANRLAVH